MEAFQYLRLPGENDHADARKSDPISAFLPSKMRFSKRLWIVLLLAASALGQAASPQNAAVKYLRADIALRESYAFPADPSTALEKALNAPLDKNSENLVAAAEEALREFQHGTEMKRCDWELSAQDGPSANTSHRGAIRDLVLVSGLRARLRFRDNRPADAIEDSLAAMKAARQLSEDGSVASALISYQLEDKLSQILAHNLARLSPSQLRQLAARLSSLPGGSDLPAALRAEELDRHPLATVVRGATSRDDLINRLLDGVPVLNGDRQRAQDLVDGCGGSVRGFAKCMDQQRSFYESWLARFSLPPERFEKDYNQQWQSGSDPNPFILHYTVALPRLRWAEAYAKARRRLLRAAIAVRLDGPAALVRFNDPYQSDLFSYVPLEHGFRLESDLADETGPIGLTIAPEPQ